MSSVFAARTCLPAGWPAAEDRLASLRRRWSQTGVEAQIDVVDGEPDGPVLHYRLSVSPQHPDPVAVHRAFRGDLDQTLAALGSAAPPASWDLAEMARATVDAQPPVTPVYQSDADYPWDRRRRL